MRDGHGEIAFDAMQAGLDIAYSADDIHLTWCGFDEMDELQGDGCTQLRGDGSISIDFAYHNSGEAALKAVRHRISMWSQS